MYLNKICVTGCFLYRVVLHGKTMIQAVKPESVEVYDFKQAFGLAEEEVH